MNIAVHGPHNGEGTTHWFDDETAVGIIGVGGLVPRRMRKTSIECDPAMWRREADVSTRFDDCG